MDEFGALLKDWRARRKVSQLELGLVAEVSTRHIACLETGKARPSREMVLRLGRALDAPRAARNELLAAAGFAPVFRRRAPSDAEMAQVRAAVDWTLTRHDPYPALALDRHWRIEALNRCAGTLLGAVGVGVGDSLLDAIHDGAALWDAIENRAEVARHFATRLRTEAIHLGGDPLLEAAAMRLAREAGPSPRETEASAPAVLPTRLRLGEVTLALFSSIAQLGGVEDIALADLRLELMFPADDATRAVLEAMAGRAA